MIKSRPILIVPGEILAILSGKNHIILPIEEEISPETNAIVWGYMERKYVPWNLPDTYLGGVKTGASFACPFGVQEDRLWVKESVWLSTDKKTLVAYDADCTDGDRPGLKKQGLFLQRATHMKQEFSRLILTVKTIEAVKNKDTSWSWKINIERNS